MYNIIWQYKYSYLPLVTLQMESLWILVICLVAVSSDNIQC